MFAEIIAVGSEMLTPQKVDTNSLWLTQELNDLGVELSAKTIIGDDRTRLCAAVCGALGRAEIVVVTGGLGPTEDDVTREAVALALGRALRFDEKICSAIEARFRSYGRTMAEINKRQAFVIEGAEALPNDRGTAPGQWIDADDQGRIVMLLPGPPGELKAMWERECRWRLRARLPQQFIRVLQWRVAGMPESDLDQLISPVYTRYSNPVTTILAAAGDIQIHMRARCATADEADALLHEVACQIEPLLGDRLYSKDGCGLDEHVIRMLRQRGETVCVAESATGGLVAQRLTSVAGSSAAFMGGFLTYTDAAKTALLGVSEAVLRNYGAVSEPVAHSMAIGARERFGTDYALSVTGYAGPEGGTDENPVGTIFIGLAAKDAVEVKRFRFPGDRARIRSFAAHAALDLLRRRLTRSTS